MASLFHTVSHNKKEAVDISESLSKLTLTNQDTDLPCSSQQLYIDILNYSTDFFPLNEPWSMSKSLGRVTEFVSSARKAGFGDIKCFIDDMTQTSEAETKWRTRREKEVRAGWKKIPQGLTIILGDMLQQCGVEILYSSVMDNDDTLAFYAGKRRPRLTVIQQSNLTKTHTHTHTHKHTNTFTRQNRTRRSHNSKRRQRLLQIPQLNIQTVRYIRDQPIDRSARTLSEKTARGHFQPIERKRNSSTSTHKLQGPAHRKLCVQTWNSFTSLACAECISTQNCLTVAPCSLCGDRLQMPVIRNLPRMVYDRVKSGVGTGECYDRLNSNRCRDREPTSAPRRRSKAFFPSGVW